MKSISVIIPAFNVEKYIAETLESVLNQDPPFDEIIVINDGSSDNTALVVDKYKTAGVIQIIKTNEGLGPARNAGIELSKSEYLYFLDGDDVLKDGMTAEIQAIFKEHPEPIDAIFFSAADFDEKNKNLASSRYFERKSCGLFHSGRQALQSSLATQSLPASAWLYILKRSLLESPPLRFENIYHEDAVFTPDFMLRCGFVLITKKILYLHRVRPGSIMTMQSTERHVYGMLQAAKHWLRRSEKSHSIESNLYQREAANYYNNAIRSAAHAKISYAKLAPMINNNIPQLSANLKYDFFISKISARLSFELIRMRIRLQYRVK